MKQDGRGKNENSLANLKSFEKGKSGNPGGRPKGGVSLLTELKKKLEDPAVMDTVANALVQHIIAGNAQAIKQAFDRIDGPVPVVIDDVSKLSDAELIERAKNLFGGNRQAWSDEEEE